MTSPTESITCPWCQQHWVTRPGLDCARCGGPLPPPPGPSLSLAPPPAPRKLPDAFLDRLKKRYFGLWFGNLFLMIGLPVVVLGLVLTCFAGPFALIPLGIGGVFATIGYMFRRHESRKMNATLDVLSRGMAAEARIAQITRDPRELYNGEPAYSVVYVFFVGGARYGGTMNSHDPVNATHQPGEPLWVVYNPADPNHNSLWPPIA
jgi:hypothetical protein